MSGNDRPQLATAKHAVICNTAISFLTWFSILAKSKPKRTLLIKARSFINQTNLWSRLSDLVTVLPAFKLRPVFFRGFFHEKMRKNCSTVMTTLRKSHFSSRLLRHEFIASGLLPSYWCYKNNHFESRRTSKLRRRCRRGLLYGRSYGRRR